MIHCVCADVAGRSGAKVSEARQQCVYETHGDWHRRPG